MVCVLWLKPAKPNWGSGNPEMVLVGCFVGQIHHFSRFLHPTSSLPHQNFCIFIHKPRVNSTFGISNFWLFSDIFAIQEPSKTSIFSSKPGLKTAGRGRRPLQWRVEARTGQGSQGCQLSHRLRRGVAGLLGGWGRNGSIFKSFSPSELENGPVEIVSFTIKTGDFP